MAQQSEPLRFSNYREVNHQNREPAGATIRTVVVCSNICLFANLQKKVSFRKFSTKNKLAMDDTRDSNDADMRITADDFEDQPRDCFHFFCKLALTSHDMHDVLRQAMSTELKCELEQLRDIKQSFAGTCGIIAARENTVCRSHRDSFTFPLAVQVFANDVGPESTKMVILRFGLNKSAFSQWFIGKVHIIFQNSLYVHCPDIEVTICKDGSDAYEPCIVMHLQNNKADCECTELENGDKINVRMLSNGKTYPLSPTGKEEDSIFPITIKIV